MKRKLTLTAAMGILVMSFSLGCPGEYDNPIEDSAADAPQDSVGTQQDGPALQPDTAYQDPEPIPWPDFSWPDTQAPSDIYPWPPDTYSGSPFGCRWDSDCFGLKCCPTPWGIKLCANTCKF